MLHTCEGKFTKEKQSLDKLGLSFSKANIDLKRLFSSKVIHKSVSGLADREK